MAISRTIASICISLSVLGSIASAQVVGGIVSQQEASRHGLARAWYAQADVNGARGKIVGMTLYADELFVQTSRAQLQAFDAETGATQWSVTVGDARYPCYAPAASADHVATINGSTLYVIDRNTGREAWHKALPKVPGGGPAITPDRVFVPMLEGTMIGYDLKKPDGIPFIYKSFGRILVQPVATADSLVWTTERGYMYLMNLKPFDNRLRANYRVETNNQIESRPGHWTPYLYSVSLDGYVLAVHEETGRIHWKFAAAEPIIESPVAVNGKVYICKDEGGMYCLDGTTGEKDWYAPTATQFVAVSASRVYAADRLNRILILDAATGARVDNLPIGNGVLKLRNTQNDRIYLATNSGVVQCLHEAALVEPLKYIPPPLHAEDKPKTVQKGLEKHDENEQPAEEHMEGTAEEKPEAEPAEEESNPFGAGGGAPADEEEEEDNPFG